MTAGRMTCTDGACVCDVCRKSLVLPMKHTGPAYHRCTGKRRHGLGDLVSAWLAAIGITPERVSKVLGRPCGCKKRAAKLNELGRRIGIG